MSPLLNDKLNQPNVWVRSATMALGLIVVVVISGGCEPPRTGVAKSKPQKNPAETDFDWAMQRLRRAIESFSSSGDPSLRIKRKFSYELLPPSKQQPLYTAIVRVESVSKYKPRRRTPTTDEPNQNRFDPLQDYDDSLSLDPFAEGEEGSPAILYDDRDIQGKSKSSRVESLIKAPSVKEQNVYELVYKKRHWQLVAQPESKHEQLWFEYALQK